MPSRDSDRPNVVVILADDQGAWALGSAGNAEIDTPNLDRLAQTGTRFENFFCASPVCSPARASLLTGRIPSQHGVLDWLRNGNSAKDMSWGGEGKPIEYLEGQTGYTDILARNRYSCAMTGKWHMGDSGHPQKGIGYWQAHATGGGPYYDAPWMRGQEVYDHPGYVTDVITDYALDFLDGQAASDAPFCLNVHHTAPHSPWDRDNHPTETFDRYFDTCPFESVPHVPPHPWHCNSAPFAEYDDLETRRDILSGYYTAISEMDRTIGRILDRLEADGLRENTLVFFTSDNGMNMGHHGIYGKGNGTYPPNMYDTAVKVPAIVSRPGNVPEGVVSDDMLSHYDFMPTLADYLGMDHPEADSLPGTSFAPLLRGEDLAGRDDVVVFDEYGPVRMIRTKEWKYVHRYAFGPHELYDLANDPGEVRNLVADGSHTAQIATLKGRLDSWFVRYVDPAMDGTHEAVTGKGQLGRVGPAAEGRENFTQDWYYHSTGEKGPVPDGP